MDNIQIKAIDAIRAHKDLITDRSKFKGMLSVMSKSLLITMEFQRNTRNGAL